MKTNAGKFHFSVSTEVCRINNVTNNNKFKAKISETDIESSPQEKL